jgi:hypothetical protein
VDSLSCRITCPDPDCAAASFKSPSELWIHWALKMHKGTLRVFDNWGLHPVESLALRQCPRCKVWRNSLASTSHLQSKLCRNLTDKRQAAEQVAFQKEEQKRSPFKHKGMAQVEMGRDVADFGLKTHFSEDIPSFLQSRGNECCPVLQ